MAVIGKPKIIKKQPYIFRFLQDFLQPERLVSLSNFYGDGESIVGLKYHAIYME
jgi:hypothetical protein